MAVGGEKRKSMIGARQVGENREKTVTCAAEDFEGGHGYGGGGDVAGGEGQVEGCE